MVISAANPVPAATTASEALGILGGTFDPIHFGHLRLAEECADSLRLNQVRLVPAGKPWQRSGLIAPIEHRIAMARLGVESNPRFQVDPREAERAGQAIPSIRWPVFDRNLDQPNRW